MSIFSSLIDVDINMQGLLKDMIEWVQKHALTDPAIEDLARILDKNTEFKKALKPIEAIDDKLFKAILKGAIKPEEEKQ